jgi:transposase
MALRCKGCGSEEHVKNGFMRGKQRYRCRACGLNFTDTPPRGMPLRIKVTAVLLYLSGLSMNRTAKLLGVSMPSVQAWIERFAEVYAQKPEPEGRAVVVELDEMWHFLKRGYQASIDKSSSIPQASAKRAKSAIEASTMRSALETTQVRRRNRASQCRWREWSRSMPWVSSLPTNSRPCGISSA